MSRVALITSAFLVGLFGRSLCPITVRLGWLAVVGLFLGGLVAARSRMHARGTHLLLVGGALFAGVAQPVNVAPRARAISSTTMQVEAHIESARASPRGSACVLVVDNARSLDGRTALVQGSRVWASPMLFVEGTRVRFLARVRSVARFDNPSPHPPWPSIAAIDYKAHVLAPSQIRVIESSPFRNVFEQARAHIRRALRTSLSERVAGIAMALVLGDANAVAPEDNDTVRHAGLSHVLAVSGMHVAILAGMAVLALRSLLLRLPALAERIDVRRIACALGAILALLYAEFAGGSPSAWRAAWTATFAWSLVAAGKRPRAGPVGACAALAMSVFEPTLVTRPAFLLSVLATASLVALPCVEQTTISGYAIELSRASLRASIATLPVLVWCFDGAPIIGVIANGALIPLGSIVLLPLATLHAVLASCAPSFVFLTRAPTELTTTAFLEACSFFERVELGRTVLPLSGAQLTALSFACAGVLLLGTSKQRIAVLVASLAALLAAELWLRHSEAPRGVLRATFLDVGQGDSTLIDLPDGRFMVIDAGGNPDRGPDPGALVLVPLLEARRRSRIDVFVLSHPHPDHYGGLAALLGRIPITEIWDSGQAEDEGGHDEAAALLRRARSLGTRVRTPRELCDKVHAFGRARIVVLAPCPRYDAGYDPNDNSLALRVDIGQRRLLFTGDAEAHEEELLARLAGRDAIDVWKVGHHGSRTSSSTVFLNAFRPRIAIVSAGRGNRFGHPHPQALERLRDARASVTRLDEVGGTVVESDGETLEITTRYESLTLPPASRAPR